MRALPLAGREEYEPLGSLYPLPSRLARSTEDGTSHAGKTIPAGPLWVRRNFRRRKASAREGDSSLILGMRGMMSVSSATGGAVSWFPIGLMRKEHAA